MANETQLYQVYYIPGFPGTKSDTAKKLNEIQHKYGSNVIELNYNPDLPWHSLLQMEDQVVESEAHPIIVASSLGGWFAERLQRRVPCDLILWNPSLHPDLTKYGMPVKYDAIESVDRSTPRTVFLGELDDVVNMDYAHNIYKNKARINILKEGHCMSEAGLIAASNAIEDHRCFLSKSS